MTTTPEAGPQLPPVPRADVRNPRESATRLQQWITDNPTHPEVPNARMGMARTSYIAGDRQAAIDEANDILTDPSTPPQTRAEAQGLRGAIAATNKNFSEAQQAFEDAAQINPHQQDVRLFTQTPLREIQKQIKNLEQKSKQGTLTPQDRIDLHFAGLARDYQQAVGAVTSGTLGKLTHRVSIAAGAVGVAATPHAVMAAGGGPKEIILAAAAEATAAGLIAARALGVGRNRTERPVRATTPIDLGTVTETNPPPPDKVPPTTFPFPTEPTRVISPRGSGTPGSRTTETTAASLATSNRDPDEDFVEPFDFDPGPSSGLPQSGSPTTASVDVLDFSNVPEPTPPPVTPVAFSAGRTAGENNSPGKEKKETPVDPAIRKKHWYVHEGRAYKLHEIDSKNNSANFYSSTEGNGTLARQIPFDEIKINGAWQPLWDDESVQISEGFVELIQKDSSIPDKNATISAIKEYCLSAPGEFVKRDYEEYYVDEYESANLAFRMIDALKKTQAEHLPQSVRNEQFIQNYMRYFQADEAEAAVIYHVVKESRPDDTQHSDMEDLFNRLSLSLSELYLNLRPLVISGSPQTSEPPIAQPLPRRTPTNQAEAPRVKTFPKDETESDETVRRLQAAIRESNDFTGQNRGDMLSDWNEIRERVATNIADSSQAIVEKPDINLPDSNAAREMFIALTEFVQNPDIISISDQLHQATARIVNDRLSQAGLHIDSDTQNHLIDLLESFGAKYQKEYFNDIKTNVENGKAAADYLLLFYERIPSEMKSPTISTNPTTPAYEPATPPTSPGAENENQGEIVPLRYQTGGDTEAGIDEYGNVATNRDAYWYGPDGNVVCDGVNSSRKAASIVTASIKDSFESKPDHTTQIEAEQWLKEILYKANEKLAQDPDPNKGSTAVSVDYLWNGILINCKIGDPKSAILRDDKLIPASVDTDYKYHFKYNPDGSLATDQGDGYPLPDYDNPRTPQEIAAIEASLSSVINPATLRGEEATLWNMRRRTWEISGKPIREQNITLTSTRLLPGDKIIHYTDGIEILTDQDIIQVLTTHADPQQAAKELNELAKQKEQTAALPDTDLLLVGTDLEASMQQLITPDIPLHNIYSWDKYNKFTRYMKEIKKNELTEIDFRFKNGEYYDPLRPMGGALHKEAEETQKILDSVTKQELETYLRHYLQDVLDGKKSLRGKGYVDDRTTIVTDVLELEKPTVPGAEKDALSDLRTTILSSRDFTGIENHSWEVIKQQVADSIEQSTQTIAEKADIHISDVDKAREMFLDVTQFVQDPDVAVIPDPDPIKPGIRKEAEFLVSKRIEQAGLQIDSNAIQQLNNIVAKYGMERYDKYFKERETNVENALAVVDYLLLFYQNQNLPAEKPRAETGATTTEQVEREQLQLNLATDLLGRPPLPNEARFITMGGSLDDLRILTHTEKKVGEFVDPDAWKELLTIMQTKKTPQSPLKELMGDAYEGARQEALETSAFFPVLPNDILTNQLSERRTIDFSTARPGRLANKINTIGYSQDYGLIVGNAQEHGIAMIIGKSVRNYVYENDYEIMGISDKGVELRNMKTNEIRTDFIDNFLREIHSGRLLVATEGYRPSFLTTIPEVQLDTETSLPAREITVQQPGRIAFQHTFSSNPAGKQVTDVGLTLEGLLIRMDSGTEYLIKDVSILGSAPFGKTSINTSTSHKFTGIDTNLQMSFTPPLDKFSSINSLSQLLDIMDSKHDFNLHFELRRSAPIPQTEENDKNPTLHDETATVQEGTTSQNAEQPQSEHPPIPGEHIKLDDTTVFIVHHTSENSIIYGSTVHSKAQTVTSSSELFYRNLTQNLYDALKKQEFANTSPTQPIHSPSSTGKETTFTEGLVGFGKVISETGKIAKERMNRAQEIRTLLHLPSSPTSLMNLVNKVFVPGQTVKETLRAAGIPLPEPGATFLTEISGKTYTYTINSVDQDTITTIGPSFPAEMPMSQYQALLAVNAQNPAEPKAVESQSIPEKPQPLPMNQIKERLTASANTQETFDVDPQSIIKSDPIIASNALFPGHRVHVRGLDISSFGNKLILRGTLIMDETNQEFQLEPFYLSVDHNSGKLTGPAGPTIIPPSRQNVPPQLRANVENLPENLMNLFNSSLPSGWQAGKGDITIEDDRLQLTVHKRVEEQSPTPREPVEKTELAEEVPQNPSGDTPKRVGSFKQAPIVD